MLLLNCVQLAQLLWSLTMASERHWSNNHSHPQQLWCQTADVPATGWAVHPAHLHPRLQARTVVAVTAGCVDGSRSKAAEGLPNTDAADHLVAP